MPLQTEKEISFPSSKIYLKTYGCQMNFYDSEKIVDLLKGHGCVAASEPHEADVIILNTCHIREKACDKLFSDLGRFYIYKKKRPKNPVTLVVAGCIAQAQGEALLKRAPYIDIIIGPQAYHQLPKMMWSLHKEKKTKETSPKHIMPKHINLDFPVEPKFDFLPYPTSPQGPSVFLSIQEGCDKFCTFCVVPYTRGAEYSRPCQDIIDEAKILIDKGAVEIVLLGQNVNAYHGKGPMGAPWGLGRLIQALSEIPGLERIRYTTSHPRDMDEELLQAHTSVPQLMPLLHLPVQSGSDAVLQRMNRRHTASFYLEWIERLRQNRPGIAFSSDFIVGFPGETDKDFEQTLDLVKKVTYAQAYSFGYSPRPGTPSAINTASFVDPATQKSRLHALQALLNEQQHQFNLSMVGHTISVLVERKSPQPNIYMGRTPHGQIVHIEGLTHLVSPIVSVHITHGLAKSLKGHGVDCSVGGGV